MHGTSYDIMLLVMFVNVKVGGDKQRDTGGEEVRRSSNTAANGLNSPDGE